MSVNCTGLPGQEHTGGSDVDPYYLLNISDPFQDPDFPTPGPSHFNVHDVNECAELCLFYRNFNENNCWNFNYHDEGHCHMVSGNTILQEDEREGAVASSDECFVLILFEDQDNGLHQNLIIGLSTTCSLLIICCIAFAIYRCILERRTRRKLSFEDEYVVVEIPDRKAALTISEKIDIALGVLEEERRRKYPSRIMRLKDKLQLFPDSSVKINMTSEGSNETRPRALRSRGSEVEHIKPEQKVAGVREKESFLRISETVEVKKREEVQEIGDREIERSFTTEKDEKESQDSVVPLYTRNCSHSPPMVGSESKKNDSTKVPKSPNNLSWPPEGTLGICPPSAIPVNFRKRGVDQETIDLMNEPLSLLKLDEEKEKWLDGKFSEVISRDSFAPPNSESITQLQRPREVTESSLNADDYPTPRRVAPSAPELYRGKESVPKRKKTFDVLRHSAIFNFIPSRKQPQPPPIGAVPRGSLGTFVPVAPRAQLPGLPLAPSAPSQNPDAGRLSARLPLSSLLLPLSNERAKSCTTMQEMSRKGRTVTIDGAPPGSGTRIRWVDL